MPVTNAASSNALPEQSDFLKTVTEALKTIHLQDPHALFKRAGTIENTTFGQTSLRWWERYLVNLAQATPETYPQLYHAFLDFMRIHTKCMSYLPARHPAKVYEQQLMKPLYDVLEKPAIPQNLKNRKSVSLSLSEIGKIYEDTTNYLISDKTNTLEIDKFKILYLLVTDGILAILGMESECIAEWRRKTFQRSEEEFLRAGPWWRKNYQKINMVFKSVSGSLVERDFISRIEPEVNPCSSDAIKAYVAALVSCWENMSDDEINTSLKSSLGEDFYQGLSSLILTINSNVGNDTTRRLSLRNRLLGILLSAVENPIVPGVIAPDLLRMANLPYAWRRVKYLTGVRESAVFDTVSLFDDLDKKEQFYRRNVRAAQYNYDQLVGKVLGIFSTGIQLIPTAPYDHLKAHERKQVDAINDYGAFVLIPATIMRNYAKWLKISKSICGFDYKTFISVSKIDQYIAANEEAEAFWSAISEESDSTPIDTAKRMCTRYLQGNFNRTFFNRSDESREVMTRISEYLNDPTINLSEMTCRIADIMSTTPNFNLAGRASGFLRVMLHKFGEAERLTLTQVQKIFPTP